MPALRIVLTGACVVLSLGACTSAPDSATGTTPPTIGADARNVLDQPPRITRIQTSVYAEGSGIPRRIQVDHRSVATRLQCPKGRIGIVPGFAGEMTLRELALFLTREPRDSTAIIIMRSKGTGVLFHLNKRDVLISRVDIYRTHTSWFPNQITSCARN